MINLNQSYIFDAATKRTQLWKSLCVASDDLVDTLKAKKESQSLEHKVCDLFQELQLFEPYWAFPGLEINRTLSELLNTRRFFYFHSWARKIELMIVSNSYRTTAFPAYQTTLIADSEIPLPDEGLLSSSEVSKKIPYFETLVLRDETDENNELYARYLSQCRTEKDEFVYQTLFVNSVEDAVFAILVNPTIQSCLVLPGFTYKSNQTSPLFRELLLFIDKHECAFELDPMRVAAMALKSVRPQIDLFLISFRGEDFLSSFYRTLFSKIIYSGDSFLTVHHHIMGGIRDRYETPFFNALQAYARKPKGVFHALPVSRGSSLVNSYWVDDLFKFYGPQLFLAETSSTHGGLDSLLDPKGPIKQAHHKASKTFGAQHSFFVTNGTSTSNKIVTQSLLRPGDIALISSDCHKSLSYSILLTGAYPYFLNTYPLPKYAMFGAVTLKDIKQALLNLKRQGCLEKVKLIVLTNSTFDGLIYNTEQVMEEVLAIKPDIVFHWDEAWFSFAHFNPLYKTRSAMSVATRLNSKFSSNVYREFYKKWKESFDKHDLTDDEVWLTTRLYPDPSCTTLRVYSTQSTHKTLTSFRQGSMIHINDEEFNQDLFLEAFYTHTSTSPNYQIIASLDAGRRQVSLEGYELVKRTIELALFLRKAISTTPLIRSYFYVLEDVDLIGNTSLTLPLDYESEEGLYSQLALRWKHQEFVVDPTRISVDISKTGLTGTGLQQLLINRFDIQVNKTAANSVLFIVNIGSTLKTVTYLLDVLTKIAEELEEETRSRSADQLDVFYTQVKSLSTLNTPLPSYRKFFKGFTPYHLTEFPIGDIRSAFFLAYDVSTIMYRLLDQSLIDDVSSGCVFVSAAFVTPYPPGFPILVPGQVVSVDIVQYLIQLNIKEIHGFKSTLGLKLFTPSALDNYSKNKGDSLHA